MIIKIIENIESGLKSFFLNDVIFYINDKVIKKGKIINASIKDFFIIFKIEVQKGGIKTFEVPYPFNINYKNNEIVFDYKINSLVDGDAFKFCKAKNFKTKKMSKFYDCELIIRKNNE